MKPIIRLRPLLWFDAATCALMGLALAFDAVALSHKLGLPLALVRDSGITLLLFSAIVGWAATSLDRPRLIQMVIGANVAWSLGSFAVVGLFAPTVLGATLVIAQALAVATIAGLEYAASCSPALRA
jgi:hypothetical protein